jgi:hypothetical protein
MSQFQTLHYLSNADANNVTDQWQGCVSAVFASTKTEQSGQYICPPAVPERGSELYRKEGLDEDVMKLTREIVQEKMYDQSVAKGCPLDFY